LLSFEILQNGDELPIAVLQKSFLPVPQGVWFLRNGHSEVSNAHFTKLRFNYITSSNSGNTGNQSRGVVELESVTLS
jgi:hypothetical protein